MSKSEVILPKKLKQSVGSFGLSNQMMGMFKSGKTVKEIADQHGLAWSTVKERLVTLAKENGETITIEE